MKKRIPAILMLICLVGLSVFGYLRTPKVLNAEVMSYLEKLITNIGDNSSTTQTDPETDREIDVYVDGAFTVKKIIPFLSKPAEVRRVRDVPELSPPIIRIGEKMLGNHQKLYYTSPVGVIEYSLAETESMALLLFIGTETRETYPEAREAFSEGVIRQLQAESGDLVTVTFTDYSKSNFDYENNKFKGIDIRTPEATELLFACIRNCDRIHDYTNIPVDDYFLPLEVNGQYAGNFVRMYFPYEETGQSICIYFSEEDSSNFSHYVNDYLAKLPAKSA